jgi:hypothetical protein
MSNTEEEEHISKIVTSARLVHFVPVSYSTRVVQWPSAGSEEETGLRESLLVESIGIVQSEIC